MKKRRRRTKVTERTVAVITGLKLGDAQLAHQPLLLANLAYELGRVDRRTFLAEAAKVIPTSQVIGRLFSFHKAQLVARKFIRFEKVPRSLWLKEQADAPAAKPATTILASGKAHEAAQIAQPPPSSLLPCS